MGDLIDKDGFRANVGIVLMNDSGQLFLGRRTGGRGWQFPQGGMKRGEGAEDSLFRELKEEVGLGKTDVRVIAQSRNWIRYRLPLRYQRHDSSPKCIGQKQRWFLLQLAGDESAIRLDTTREPEFDRWRWVDYWQPIREVIFFKRPVYTRALHDLGLLAFPQGLPDYPDWWHRKPVAAESDAAPPGGEEV
jgi:putative (di)nucleoside polyphosphate hydrolase